MSLPLRETNRFARPAPEPQAAVVADAVAVPDTLPPASYAATPSVYDVPHVSPVNENDVDVDVPACAAVQEQAIPGHPDVVARRVQESDIEVWPTPEVARPAGVEGGVVSLHCCVCWLTLATGERFPAAS